ncbi:peptidylprolyl isomerase [uncultured Sphingomonas sp.]|uniref:peptidylprolyl isomerase n=1 Tax=uncultured Sphingomonas sp. TaxID=158754 RepID=UPI0025D8A5A0|nr:peptidylprolyl isomerase [uncultured Sphingomonas sp.]
MTKTRGAVLTRRAMASLLGLAIAGGAVAQTVDDQTLPDNTGLNIPANLQIFGKLDPNIRKATAIVNETVITGTDMDQRVALIAAANNAKLTDEDRERLRLQVLRQLIDETLQIQQAKTADIVVSKEEIDQAIGRVAKQFNKSPAEFAAWLREQGSSDRSMRRQIEGELAWNRYLRKRVEPFVNVGDEEVKAIIDRLQAAKGTEEYHLAEIYLPANSDQQAQVEGQARQIIGEIQKAQAPFSYFARNYSAATTRSVGGDLGWVRAAQLPEALSAASQQMQVGQVAGPIPIPGGFSIIYLVDKRQVLTADPRDARLSLKQMTIKFPANTTQAQATARTAQFAAEIRKLQGCGSVEKVGQTLNAEVVQNDTVRIRDLPGPLQDIMLKLQVGQASPPFGSPTEGVRTLVLCGRDDPVSGQLPGAEQIQNQLEQQRVNLRAQQALRDLRRDAVIDYR